MKDKMIRAIDETGTIRAHVAVTTSVVEEARNLHNTSKTATAALGRALTAGLLLRNNLKNEKDSLTLNIIGSGDLGRIVVTGKNDDYIKGYVDNPSADVPVRESDGKLDVGRLVGPEGRLSVVMDLGLKEPYVGQVPLHNGEIAEDVAHYLLQSEQIHSAVGLGVLIGKDMSVSYAGGFIIQLMPDVEEATIERLENNLKDMKSVTELLATVDSVEEFLEKLLPDFKMEIIEDKPVYFKCECSKEKVEDALSSLAPTEIREMIDEDGGAEVTCHFCNQVYNFDEGELEHVYDMSRERFKGEE